MQNRDTALDYVKIGHRVKVSRKEENLSQEALAEKCATTSRYLSDIENGKCRPSLDLLARICVALDVSIDSLLYDSPIPYTGYLVKNSIPEKVNKLNKQSLIFLDRMLDLLLEGQSTEGQDKE